MTARERLGARFGALRAGARLPGHTVRLRLTLLYGALFLISGVGLLTVTNLLVRESPGNNVAILGLPAGPSPVNAIHPGLTARLGPSQVADSLVPGWQAAIGITSAVAPRADRAALAAVKATQSRLKVAQSQITKVNTQLGRIVRVARAQPGHELHQLLITSALALAVMTVISIALGWLMAGRVLRPLQTITAAARDISATNLHQRLALEGPNDELHQLGNTFDELLGRLEGSFEAQRQFVANASHELRTPLARQRTVAEVALSDPGATVQSLRESHERVIAAGEQQERLIEALLTLARSERGLARRESFDLAAVTEAVLTSHHAELAHGDLQLEAALDPAPTSGDPRLGERLVANLIDNAIRHNRPNGSVQVATAARDGRATLSVANSGPIVPPSEIDRLFEPFQRLERSRTANSDGAGLGLSIAAAIARAHGGTLVARPRPGGGLVVEASLPS